MLDNKGVILIFLVLVIVVCYLAMYNLREKFGIYKRKINGLYNGIKDDGDYHWSLPEDERLIIQDVLKSILNQVNKQKGSKLFFMYIDKVDKEDLCNGKVRHVVDFFAHELSNQTTKRLIIIFKLCNKSKNVEVEKITLSNAIKLPIKHFMDYSGDKLILKDENIGNNLGQSKYHIMGVNNSNIEYSVIKDPIHKKIPTPKDFHSWILPKQIQTCSLNALLNKENKGLTEWNIDGIEIGCKSKGALDKLKPYNGDNPTVNRMESVMNEYWWLHDLARGNVGVPHGQSVSG